MASKKNLIFGILTSGKFSDRWNEEDMEEIVRYIILNAAFIVGGLLLIGFGVSVTLEGLLFRGILDFILAIIVVIAFFMLRTKIPMVISGVFPIALFGVLCGILVQSGDQQGFAGLWIYSYPLISIFVLGLKLGTIMSLLVLAGISVLTLVPGVAGFAYSYDAAFRLSGVYLLVLVLAIVYEQVRLFKDRGMEKLTRALQTERDEITAMKDNLKVGLFLMDRDFVIQGAYSKALEDVLATSELQGKNFLNLLSASVKAKELETLKDYFGMIFNRSFDQKMLDDINPLRELYYKSVESGDDRILDCGFAPVNRNEREVFILGTLQDITAEKELQRQLEEEEGKRQEEMRSLFEVVQVEPGIFNDFIDDSEYEFERVNDILKDRELSTGQAMVEIYQSVHAIKSNALILGLEGFGKKLHGLEEEIKTIREKETIPFEDVLHVTVELEQIMREKDKFRETIDRILAFRGGGAGKQSEHVLVETLTKASTKAAKDMNKDVRFVPREIDATALESGSRRVIKEILTQLVRNAVVHGIEEPEDRTAAGKDAQGTIHLSITLDDDKIHIRLKDDGRGLDFDKIKKRALEMRLLSEDEAGSKTQLLRALFMPGFSTADTVNVHAGRGVGLSLVQDRLREVKGSVKVNTEKGKGTTFHIFIPLESNAEVSKAS
jgi:two-component system chemotaxis sensor kinase CheA